jgi:molybdenum transport protein
MLKAVLVAGCTPHRLGRPAKLLAVGAQRGFLDAEPPRKWIARLRAARRNRRILVEATTVAEAVRFACAGADGVQMEGLSPAQLAEVVLGVGAMDKQPVLVVGGGIDAANAAAYAATGVDVLVTPVPQASPPLPVELLVTKAYPALHVAAVAQ